MSDAANATRRDDPAQYLGQVLLTHDTRLPGGSLAAFGKLLADAVLAAIGGDARLLDAGEWFDLDRVLRCPNADPLERVGLVQREHGADRNEALRRLRLHRRGRDELQIEHVVEGFAPECRDQLRRAPP